MTVRILTGDCRAMLLTLPDESVHCCVTSPPYFGLRDYGHDEMLSPSCAASDMGFIRLPAVFATTGKTKMEKQ